MLDSKQKEGAFPLTTLKGEKMPKKKNKIQLNTVKPSIIYYCTQAKCGFNVDDRDANGEKIPLTNDLGNPRLEGGEFVYKYKRYEFSLVKAGKGDFLCQFPIIEGKTPEAVKRRLKELAAQPGKNIYTYEDYIKSKNKDQYREMMRADEAELKIKANGEVHAQEMQEMQKKLDDALKELEGKK